MSIDSFGRALQTLENISKENFTTIVRDATIQRFEYTFEAMWKTVKAYLSDSEGIVCNSPKSCFRELLSSQRISVSDTELLLEMTDMRNLTSHTYIEQIAQDIYAKITADYITLMRRVYNAMQK
jgi:nucleotidyltransferase substrate binding protein (TIGR01987 family)